MPTSLGRPIAATERIQTIAGEIEAQLVQAEEVLYGLAGRIDADDADGLQRCPSPVAGDCQAPDRSRQNPAYGTDRGFTFRVDAKHGTVQDRRLCLEPNSGR